MKKIIFVVLLASVLFNSSVYARGEGWNIDQMLKLQLVYFPQHQIVGTSVDAEHMEPLLKNISASRPDIDNIVYSNLLSMGFPLPEIRNADSLKLYLKMYAWPAKLNSARSACRIFDAFLLDKIRGGRRLYASARNAADVYVKYALVDAAERSFSDESPFTAPAVPTQWEFDADLPFSSIYVTPEKVAYSGTESDRAQASARGVIAFHADLEKVYSRSLRLLAADGEKKYYADLRGVNNDAGLISAVRIYEVPLKPLVFANYRELPMPQNAEKVFLSGLLLVKLSDYTAISPVSEKELAGMLPGSVEFESRFNRVWSHMLEIGSVFVTDNKGKN